MGLILISSLHAIGVCPYTSRDFGHILWRRWTQNQRNKFFPPCAIQFVHQAQTTGHHLGFSQKCNISHPDPDLNQIQCFI